MKWMNKLLAALVLVGCATSAHAGGAADRWHDRNADMRMIRAMFDQTSVGGNPIAGGVGSGSSSSSGVFLDTVFTLQDNADTTRQAQFQLSPITPGQTRVYTVKDSNGTIPLLETVNTWSGSSNIFSGSEVCLGTGCANFGGIIPGTTQTPDAPALATGVSANIWLLYEYADRTFDFAHAAATDPTLIGHSHNQSTTEFWSITHDGTRPVMGAGGTNGYAFPRGTSNEPGIQWAGDADGTGSGMYSPGSGRTSLVANNVVQMEVNTSGLAGIKLNTGCISWGTGFVSPIDLVLCREGSATAQFGSDVNAAPTDQTIKAHDGITGTNIAGAALIVESGLGTGNAVSGPYTVNRQITKASGTTPQTYAPARIDCPSKILSNTSATTTTIATITTTSTTAGNVTMDYGVSACSGSTCDADGGLVKVAWNNNAGTVAAAMTAVALQADSDATGNITSGPTVTVATNVVSIKVTPVFTTIVPTTVIFTSSFVLHTAGDTVVCQ